MTAKLAFIFPGQGSQYVGMGKDLYETFNTVKRIYDESSEVLGIDIKSISFFGPEEELRKTYLTQPAVLVHSIAALEILKEKNILPSIVMGHSLGEYTALYSAEVLDLVSVLKLVKKRGELMYSCGKETPGTMAAIIGLNEEKVKEICASIQGICVIANFNSPSQLVISGEIEAVKEAVGLCQKEGAIKTVMLPVSGAFHSPLLKPAYEEFKDYLYQFEFREPKIGIIMNTTGELVRSREEVLRNLKIQLISPVQWTKSINTALNLGYKIFYEVGPGKVLAGLLKKISNEVEVCSIGKVEDFKNMAI